jgi:hypothetical protein
VHQLDERYSRRVYHNGSNGLAQGDFDVVAVVDEVQLGRRNIGAAGDIESWVSILDRKIEQSRLPYFRGWSGYDGHLQEPHMDAASALPGEHVQNVSLYWVGLEPDFVDRGLPDTG